MKALIDRILRSAQRLQEFWKLSQEDGAARYGLRREICLHLRHSITLFIRDLFGRRG